MVAAVNSEASQGGNTVAIIAAKKVKINGQDVQARVREKQNDLDANITSMTSAANINVTTEVKKYTNAAVSKARGPTIQSAKVADEVSAASEKELLNNTEETTAKAKVDVRDASLRAWKKAAAEQFDIAKVEGPKTIDNAGNATGTQLREQLEAVAQQAIDSGDATALRADEARASGQQQANRSVDARVLTYTHVENIDSTRALAKEEAVERLRKASEEILAKFQADQEKKKQEMVAEARARTEKAISKVATQVQQTIDFHINKARDEAMDSSAAAQGSLTGAKEGEAAAYKAKTTMEELRREADMRDQHVKFLTARASEWEERMTNSTNDLNNVTGIVDGQLTNLRKEQEALGTKLGDSATGYNTAAQAAAAATKTAKEAGTEAEDAAKVAQANTKNLPAIAEDVAAAQSIASSAQSSAAEAGKV